MTHSKNARRFFRFGGALGGAAARARFTPREIQNSGPESARGHAQQRPSAGLFHIVAVGRNGQHVNRVDRGISAVSHPDQA
jgi:hypothetical protein